MDFGVDFVSQIFFYKALSSGPLSGQQLWLGLLGATGAGCTAEVAYTDSFGLGSELE